jgi:hypothetical protein
MRDWLWFKKVVRSAVNGSAIVADVLEAILDDQSENVVEILKRAPSKFDAVDQFIVQAKDAIRTRAGRREVEKIMASHRFDSGFATDDIALRQAYNLYKKGLPISQLPRIDGVTVGRKRARQ